MKTLLILRHAKSSWASPGQPDHDRPLNERGRGAAPQIGRLLTDEGLLPDRILGSTATRVRQTVELVARHSGYGGPIEFLRELYLARTCTCRSVLSELPNDCSTALVVGHNPGLEEFVYELTGESETLPTAALARITLDLAAWSQFDTATRGTLVQIWRPKELEE